MKPTIRAVLLCAAGIPPVTALIVVDAAYWPVSVFFMLFVLLVGGVDALLCPSARALMVTARPPGQLNVGRDGVLSLTVAFRRTGMAVAVDCLLDVNDVLTRPPLRRVIVPVNTETEFDLALRADRRGMADVEAIWLRWRGPLGLFQRSHAVQGGRIPVIPDVNLVREMEIRFNARDAMHGVKVQRQKGEGREFNALKEWRPGMDTRSIDWKQSARHRALISKEYDVERNHPVVFAFDTGHLMGEAVHGLTKLDHAINASLVLGWTCLQGGDRVGAYGFNARMGAYATPTGGRSGFVRLQGFGAELDYSVDETNFTLGLGGLLGRLDRRSLVIVFSDFVDTVTADLMIDGLRRLAGRHLVLFVTFRNVELEGVAESMPRGAKGLAGSVIAADLVQERRIVTRSLEQMGILCLETVPGEVNAALVNQYMDIKRQGLI
ncbi:DUF58 domain-containing protein [Hwanghaeella sp.]|uniref:DUF58 domain-containing protein n=1 Tax=Hwanghaeella sp. TaxID=2605943 RepID=UPI003CCBB196